MQQNLEIERKWLFDINQLPDDINCISVYGYKQSYLSVEPEIRLSQKQLTLDGEIVTKQTLCIKSKGDLSRIEVQKSLTESEYKDLMIVGGITDDMIIHKKPMLFQLDDHILVMGPTDIGRDTEFCYGEIEFESEDEANAFVAPDWFGLEVTNDDAYKMANYWKRTRLERS